MLRLSVISVLSTYLSLNIVKPVIIYGFQYRFTNFTAHFLDCMQPQQDGHRLGNSLNERIRHSPDGKLVLRDGRLPARTSALEPRVITNNEQQAASKQARSVFTPDWVRARSRGSRVEHVFVKHADKRTTAKPGAARHSESSWSSHAQGCPGIPRDAQRCPGMPRNVQGCPGMPRDAQGCPVMTRNA